MECCTALQLFGARSATGWRAEQADVAHEVPVDHLSQAMQREEVMRRKCDWHLIFVRILRVRYLSACRPGPASPVEACHPR